MVELVIKIPEEMYQKIKDTSMVNILSGRRSGKKFDYVLFNAIKNGTPLTKGHGRIIDESKITQFSYAIEENIKYNIKHIGVKIVDTDAQTIIEADKETEE